jgi:hypothetical protein
VGAAPPPPSAALRFGRAVLGAAGAVALAVSLVGPAPALDERPQVSEVAELAAVAGRDPVVTRAFLESKVPEPSAQELTPEELQNVHLFADAT